MISFSMFEIIGAIGYDKLPELIVRRLLEAGVVAERIPDGS